MNTIQNVFHTAFLRNRNVFRTCAQRFIEKNYRKDIRVLSFGCSIGDEIASIRYFFPNATIFGCDVNPRLLDICRIALGDGVALFESNRADIVGNGPYDLIIASAVLCRNPSPRDYAREFPFSKFEDILGLFDECLAIGGMIAMPNAGYLFSDSHVCPHYTAVRSDIMYNSTFVDVFYRNGSVFLKQEAAYGAHVYSRHGVWEGVDDESVFDCVFEKSHEVTGPVFARLSRVPDGLLKIATMTRRNTDYCPMQTGDNFVVVEETVDIMANDDGDVVGHASSVGWRSFLRDDMHRRTNAAWFPAS